MDVPRITWSAVLRLAVIVSTLAAVLTVAASSFGEVNQPALVIAVMVVGFVASWVQTSRSTG